MHLYVVMYKDTFVLTKKKTNKFLCCCIFQNLNHDFLNIYIILNATKQLITSLQIKADLSKWVSCFCMLFIFFGWDPLLPVYSDLPCYRLWKTTWSPGLPWSQVNPNKTASKNSNISVNYNKTEAVLPTECNFTDVIARRCPISFAVSQSLAVPTTWLPRDRMHVVKALLWCSPWIKNH